MAKTDWREQPLTKLIKRIARYDPYRDALGTRFVFDENEAWRRLAFFERHLSHAKGELARQPFYLEAHQAALVACLYGWRDERTGNRRYREALLYEPRKNGKTSIAAGLISTALHQDGEPGAEIYSVASEAQQARLVFDHVCGMHWNNPKLEQRVKIYTGPLKSISLNDDPLTVYRVLTSGPEGKHGFNVHLAVLDEIHAWPNGEMYNVLKTATSARRQPLLVICTTADTYRPSICNQIVTYARAVRDGRHRDPTFLPMLYESDETRDDWRDRKVWIRVNPNLGVSKTMEYMERQFSRALIDPAEEEKFKRLDLNMQSKPYTTFLPIDRWNGCGRLPVTREMLLGLPCHGAFDLASVEDLTAAALVFHLTADLYLERAHAAKFNVNPNDVPDELYAALVWFWLPQVTALRREQQYGLQYRQWAKDGLIELTDDDSIDQGLIRLRLTDLGKLYAIQEWAFDPHNAAYISTEMARDGLAMQVFRQGTATMNEPLKALKRLVLDGGLAHGNNPVLNWQAENMAVKQGWNDNLFPVKPKDDGRTKVDGMIALLMGLGNALMSEAAGTGRSVYDERGVTVL